MTSTQTTGAPDFDGFFVPPGLRNRCQGIRISDQIWINEKVRQLDNGISSSAESMGLDYVPLYTASSGHELCADGDPANFLNGLVVNPLENSFHPTAYGHQAIADRVRAELANPVAGRASEPMITDRVDNGESVSAPIEVDKDHARLTFAAAGPSKVAMTITSPSGRIITEETDTATIKTRVIRRRKTYAIEKPEAGMWNVTVKGTSPSAGEEPTTVTAQSLDAPNEPPVARMSVTKTGRSVSVSASGSSDPDGSIAQYLWEFDDGTFASGPTASHTYTKAGTYEVTLVVKDNNGRVDVAAADTTVTVPSYTFGGFRQPVDPRPTVNTMVSGRGVGVLFGLGGDKGRSIFDPVSPGQLESLAPLARPPTRSKRRKRSAQAASPTTEHPVCTSTFGRRAPHGREPADA